MTNAKAAGDAPAFPNDSFKSSPAVDDARCTASYLSLTGNDRTIPFYLRRFPCRVLRDFHLEMPPQKNRRAYFKRPAEASPDVNHNLIVR